MIGILDRAKSQILDSYLLDLKLVQIIFLMERGRMWGRKSLRRPLLAGPREMEAWLGGPGVCFAIISKTEFEG